LRGLGLVLAGGGGKGAYQIGVWKALQEFGVVANITAVSGTSVGALNAALFVQGDYNIAENVWLNIRTDKILKLDSKNMKQVISGFSPFARTQNIDIIAPILLYMAKNRKSIFSRDGLVKIIDENLNLQQISSDMIPCFATCLEIPQQKKKYFNLNRMDPLKIKSVLLATSALPLIFDDVVIDGKSYIDGGVPVFGDNVPIKPLYDIGYRGFLVVHLSRDSIIDKKSFPGAKIIEIVPYEDQGNMLDGTLDFTREGAKKRIQQGYNDTSKILEPMYYMGITQKEIYEKLIQIANDEYNFEIERQTLIDERGKLKCELYKSIDGEGG